MVKIVVRVVEVVLLAFALSLIVRALVYNADQKRLEQTSGVTLPANTKEDLGFEPHYGRECRRH